MTNILQPVSITSISPDDLVTMGFDTRLITQPELDRLAAKMANAYLDQSFWQDLDFFAHELKLPRI